jgi:hypothetical protein
VSDVRKLRKLIQSLGGEQVRTHGRDAFWVVPGVDVEVKVPMKDKGDLPQQHLAFAAKALGLSQPELRELMDKPIVARHGNPGPVTPPAPAGPSRGECIDLLHAVRAELATIEQTIRSGQRDPQHYRRIHDSLAAARRSLRPAPASESAPLPDVDDRGYRPSRVDPLLTGPARATGATAQAVRRANATTKYEHDGGHR